MAPSESFILSSFLLSPASLHTAVSLQQFTEMFPKRLRSHPHVKALYRELQGIREQDIDQVNGNISMETRNGVRQKEELRRSVVKSGIDGMSDQDRKEVDMDTELFGQTSAMSSGDYHSVSSLLSEMESACANIEQDISDIDQEAAKILSELNTKTSELSDLRYGKIQGPAGNAEEVVDQAIEGLANLEDACYRSTTHR